MSPRHPGPLLRESRAGTSEIAKQPANPHHVGMRVVVSSNDPVRLSFLTALLADAGIDALLLDQHTSIVEGSIGAIQRRLVVSSDDYTRARRVLSDAGEID